jgi:hypothetical protein
MVSLAFQGGPGLSFLQESAGVVGGLPSKAGHRPFPRLPGGGGVRVAIRMPGLVRVGAAAPGVDKDSPSSSGVQAGETRVRSSGRVEQSVRSRRYIQNSLGLFGWQGNPSILRGHVRRCSPGDWVKQDNSKLIAFVRGRRAIRISDLSTSR